MLWQEKPDKDHKFVSDDVQDLSFKFTCAQLPVDHAWVLAKAIQMALPWIGQESGAAIHSIHGASSGNGWSRPDESAGDDLQLSKRTRLYLRLPKHRLTDAQQLHGAVLNLGEYQIEIGEARTRKLTPSTTLFSRSVCSANIEDENTFTNEVVDALENQGIQATKMLFGLSHTIHRPDSEIKARSVLLADLEFDDSIKLQQNGLGREQLMGCGIFLPHKSLAAVGSSQDND